MRQSPSGCDGVGEHGFVVLGFVLGGALLSAAITTERIVHHRYVYRAAGDALLHCSVAVLVGMGIGLMLGVPCALLDIPLRRRPDPQRSRLLARIGALTGAVVGVALYAAVLLPSKYGRTVAPVLGVAVFGLVSAATGWCVAYAVSRAIRRQRTLVALALLLFAGATAWVDMHAYLRSYGNVHVAAALAAQTLAGLGCVVLLARARATSALWWGLAGVALLSGTHAAFAKDTMSARMAVLDFGGAEKLAIQHVLWRLFDHDGDGQATRFWGSDCDDANRLSAPGVAPYRVRAFACQAVPTRLPAQSAPVFNRGTQPTRSLVWVLVDTWRADVPKALSAAFDPFVHFAGFRSCGSRTGEVISHLLGPRSCKIGGAEASLPTVFENAGYAVKAFAQINVVSKLFAQSELSPALPKLMDDARTWINEQQRQGRPYFAYLHLKGGHAPYRSAGSTARERYEASVAKTLEAVAELISTLGSEPVFVVMGDHGEEFGEHEGGAHASSLYEEVLATRLYVRSVGWPAHVESGDIGCDDLRQMVLRAVAGDPYRFEPSDRMFATLDSPRGVQGGISHTLIHALRFDSSWKIIWRPKLDIWELYDLRSDAGERKNLADEQPDRLRRGASLLLGRLQDCDEGATQSVGHQQLTSTESSDELP